MPASRSSSHQEEEEERKDSLYLTCSENFIHSLLATIRHVSRFWFTHLLLLCLLLGYAVLGALLFTSVEGPNENRDRLSLQIIRSQWKSRLWTLCTRQLNNSSGQEKSDIIFEQFDEQLDKLSSVSSNPEKKLWTFWGALFYSTTVFTTIGYGHIVPSTTAGRALTILYASIGIPLLFMVLADFGKIFTQGLKFAWATGTGARSRRGFQIDDHFNLPPWVALLVLFAYMFAGACMFIQWENWSYFEAFYFVFISMSTIGFGDYVPEHPIFMMATFVYLLFGMALTSMCINVAQESLTANFRRAARKIGTRIGFKEKFADNEGEERMRQLEAHKETEITDLPLQRENN